MKVVWCLYIPDTNTTDNMTVFQAAQVKNEVCSKQEIYLNSQMTGKFYLYAY